MGFGSLRLGWCRNAVGRLVACLFAIEGILFLSERFRWFPFNQHKGWTVVIAVAALLALLLLMLLWFALALIFRGQFQFRILSLLALTALVALVCGWLEAEITQAKGQRDVAEAIRAVGGQVTFDYLDGGRPYNGIIEVRRPAAWEWLTSLLGDDFFADITALFLSNSKITDASLKHLDFRRLRRVDWIGLDNTRVTDAGLEAIKGLPRLRKLRSRPHRDHRCGARPSSGVEVPRVTGPRLDAGHGARAPEPRRPDEAQGAAPLRLQVHQRGVRVRGHVDAP